jgi:Uma2 family endonuclease
MIAKLRTEPKEQYLRLSLVPWEAYVAFCDGLGERYLRVTYDHGEMEVMGVSRKHEKSKKRLGRLVETLTEELDLDIAYGGSMTCRNEEMLCALEPDDCYWIAHETDVRDRDEIDLDNDPLPDLAFEIEISRSALDRMSIYAALKVPEVWRWDDETLFIHVLTGRGAYRVSKRSRAFPFLPVADFASFVTRTDLTENQRIRAERAWVREHREEWSQ